MTTLLTIAVVLAFLATIAALLTGLLSMGRGGQFDEEHDTQLMGARVGLQALTVLLIIGLVLVAAV